MKESDKIKALGKIENYKHEVERVHEVLDELPSWEPAAGLKKECREVLKRMDGLRTRFDRKLVITIIGPGGAGNANFNSKFLHMTMVELARRRLLAEARAVLNVDIDELVISRSGRSIFDATVDSPQGYHRIGGQWAYALPPYAESFPRHADHRYARKDGKPRVKVWLYADGYPVFHVESFTIGNPTGVGSGFKYRPLPRPPVDGEVS